MKRILAIMLTCGMLAAAGEPLDLQAIFSQPYMTGATPTGIAWSPNDSLIAFLWNEQGAEFRNLYVANPQTGQIEQITNFNPEINMNTPAIGSVSWLTNQCVYFTFGGDVWEAGLSRERTLKRIAGIASCDGIVTKSPDGKYLLYFRNGRMMLFDRATSKEQALLPDENFQPRAIPRLSEQQTAYRWSNRSDRIAVYIRPESDATSVHFKVLNVNNGALDEVIIDSPQKRGSIVRDFIWSPDDQSLVFETVTDDLLGRFLVRVNLVASRMDTLYREKRDTWVPNFGYNLFWLEPDNKILFGIENNTFNHLYTIDPETHRFNALTRGKWSVKDYTVDASGQAVYFSGTKDQPDRLQLYVARLKTNDITNISYRGGDYGFYLANNGKFIAEVFSGAVTPPDLYWIEAAPQSKMNRLTTRSATPVSELRLKTPQSAAVRNELTGREISYRIWLPDGNLVAQKYPVIVALNGINCVTPTIDSWRPDRFANQCLSEKGYLVIEVDYTALRTAAGLSGKPKIPDPLSVQLSDIKAVVAEVGKLNYVDMTRAGIYGWGYGGYLAAMAMFKEAATFRTGAAITGDLAGSQPDRDYLHNQTQRLAADNRLFPNIDPQKFYHYLGGRFLVIQGAAGSIPELIEANRLIPDLLAGHKKVEFIIYPWEGSVIRQAADHYDLFRKMIRFFQENL